MRRSRAGYTLIELLVVMAFIGILARIAVPHFSNVKRKALAASVVADVHAVQIAAFSYYAEKNEFPPAAANGKVPKELVDYLPNGFSFKEPDWTYKWHRWNQTTGKGKSKVTETLVGVRVQSNDSKLLSSLAMMGGPGFVPVVAGKQVTFLVAHDK